MVVLVTWGHGKPIKCEVHEIEAEGDLLQSQNQYRPNLSTGQLDRVQVPSLPIGMILGLLNGTSPILERPPGMMLMSIRDWRWKLNNYLTDTLNDDFVTFPERCFRGRDLEVQREILQHLYDYYVVVPRNVGRLLIS